MTINKAVARRMIQLCKEKEISIQELAVWSGVAVKTIKDILKAPQRRRIRMITILKICNALNISAYQFFDAPEFETLEQEIE